MDAGTYVESLFDLFPSPLRSSRRHFFSFPLRAYYLSHVSSRLTVIPIGHDLGSFTLVEARAEYPR